MLEITSPITGGRLQIALNDFENEMSWFDAIQACESLGNGWRLPTKSELEIIYKELYLKGKGNFKPSIYWSSSEYDIEDAWFFTFDNRAANLYGLKYYTSGIADCGNKESSKFLRAVRLC